jgi:hypothetical protein
VKSDQRADLRLFTQLREALFDLSVDRKSADIGFGENFPAVHHHVKLAGFTRSNFRVFSEARFERRRQTGGAWLVASSSTIQYFGGHNVNCRLSPLPLQS